MVIGRTAGSRLSGVSGPSAERSTCIAAKAGRISATGWSRAMAPSSTSIIAAMPVIGLVIE
jgi:hypothetical protein